METLKYLLKAVAHALGFAERRQELANTPEMQAAAKGLTDQAIKDEAAQAIAEKDAERLRRMLSE